MGSAGMQVQFHIPKTLLTPTGKVRFDALYQLFRGLGSAPVPRWMFNHKQHGRAIYDYVVQRVVTEQWKVLDRSTNFVDPRLKLSEQSKWLKQQCGEGNWLTFIRKSKLLGGFITHYQGKALLLFKANFAWAFDSKLKVHLDERDFFYEGMYADLTLPTKESPLGGFMWRELDHLLRVDLGITFFDPETGKIDDQMLPHNRDKFAKAKGYTNWEELERKTGLYSFLIYSPIAHGSMNEKGNLGFLLQFRYPEAFDPKTPGHVHVDEFSSSWRPLTTADKKERLSHLALEGGFKEEEIPLIVTMELLAQKGAAFILKEGETVLDLFRACFRAEFDSGKFDASHIFSPVVFEGSQTGVFRVYETIPNGASNRGGRIDLWAPFQFEGLPPRLFVRMESASSKTDLGYAVIYEKDRRTHVTGGMVVRRELIPRYIIKLDDPRKLLPYTDAAFPGIQLTGEIGRRLRELAPPRVIQRYTAAVQKEMVHQYGGDKNLLRVVRYLDGLAEDL
jgi:hypothetical protein